MYELRQTYKSPTMTEYALTKKVRFESMHQQRVNHSPTSKTSGMSNHRSKRSQHVQMPVANVTLPDKYDTSRMLVFITCTIAFIYTIYYYFQMYLEYPTTVNAEVIFPQNFTKPSVTLCSKNGWRYSMISKMSSGFQRDINNSMFEVNEEQLKELETIMLKLNTSRLLQMSHNPESFFVNCQVSGSVTNRNVTSSMCSKRILLPVIWNYYLCYSVNHFLSKGKLFDGWEEDDQALLMKLDMWPELDVVFKDLEWEINVHANTMYPESSFVDFFAPPDYISMVYFTRSSIEYLPPPFGTDCWDYETLKIRNEHGHYFSCLKDCLEGIAMKTINCVPYCFPITEDTKKCTTNRTHQVNFCLRLYEVLDVCNKMCPKACHAELYDVKVQQKKLPRSFSKETIHDEKFEKRYAVIKVFLRPYTHTIYKHRLKISAVEVFSTVGGYMGIWLGLSIPLMYDMLLKISLRLKEILLFNCNNKQHRRVRQTSSRKTSPLM